MVSEGKEDETATASSHANNKCLRLLILVTMSLNSIFPKRESDFYVLQSGVTDSYCAWGAEWDHVRVLWYNKAAGIYCFHSGGGEWMLRNGGYVGKAPQQVPVGRQGEDAQDGES